MLMEGERDVGEFISGVIAFLRSDQDSLFEGDVVIAVRGAGVPDTSVTGCTE